MSFGQLYKPYDLSTFVNTHSVNDKQDKKYIDELVYGKDKTENIVAAEVVDDTFVYYVETPNGVIQRKQPMKYWLLYNKSIDGAEKLKGHLEYNYIKKYDKLADYLNEKKQLNYNSMYNVYDAVESHMALNGMTFFKGTKLEDVSVLSFDIETTGLTQDNNSRVFIISNTLRKNGKVVRKLFCYDEYSSDGEMLKAWCAWVRQVDPTLMVGHNIYIYDLPYLHHCANLCNVSLNLGRDGSELKFDQRISKFRRDASQYYDYNRAYVFGRQIIDTMFLAIKYDFKREYPSYGLKPIIDFEGLQVKNRQFYDAGKIKDNYQNPEEWKKIKAYALHDADDSLALFDKMIGAYFYLCPIIPKNLSEILNTASGSQLNLMMVRSYLQIGHSIPNRSQKEHYEGGISFGNLGIYSNVFKVDVASLYPSVIMQYGINDYEKDPKGHFLKLVTFLTADRLNYKHKYAETDDQYYEDFSQALKIIINSFYGMLGANGLNFNSPENAALVTKHSRDILTKCIEWAKNNGYKIVNADTDSISFCKENESKFTDEEKQQCLADINALYPEKISWEDDGYYKRVLIAKAKNYVLEKYTGKTTTKIIKKGVAIKAPLKEPELRNFINECVDALMKKHRDRIIFIYHKYIKKIGEINTEGIANWSKKITITDKVLNPKRPNEQKVLDAIKGKKYFHGDKIYGYFDKKSNFKLLEDWNSDHDENTLYKKLYKTLCIFDGLIAADCFPDYTLARNQEALQEVINYGI